MKKIDLGQIVTILANVGVIAGIAFLAFELRQNTVAVRSEASQGVQQHITSIYNMLMDGEIMEIYVAGMPDPGSLDPVDLARLHAFLANYLGAIENVYFLTNEGAYDPERAEG